MSGRLRISLGQHTECCLTVGFPKGVCAADDTEPGYGTRLGKRGLAPKNDLPLIKCR